MMKHFLVAATVVVHSSAPAFAGHCPKDVKAIDGALAHSSLSSSQMSAVKMNRDSGEALHNSGKHGDSQVALHKAMDALGLKH